MSRTFRSLFLRHGALTVVDQFLVSSVSLLIGGAFIYTDKPAEYGIFVGWAAMFYLTSSAVHSVANTPLMVLGGRLDALRSAALERGMFAFVGFGTATIVLILSALAPVYGLATATGSTLETLLAILCLGPLVYREYFRVYEFGSLQGERAVRRDLVYAFLCWTSVGVLVLTDKLDALSAWLAFSVPAAVVSFRVFAEGMRSRATRNDLAETLAISWPIGRWSLLGAIAGWLQNSAYIYVPFFLAGPAEVGQLAGARLLMTPITLMIGAWPNFVRPLISQRIVAMRFERMGALILQTSLANVCAVLFYGGFVLIALSLIGESVLPRGFQSTSLYVAFWVVVFAIQGLRANVSSFLQASMQFRALAWNCVLSATCTVVCAIIFVRLWGSSGSLGAIAIGESILLTTLILQMRSSTSGVFRPASSVADNTGLGSPDPVQP